jgi:hypothetical protein
MAPIERKHQEEQAMPISISENDILVNGVSTTAIAGALKTAGIAEANVAELLGYFYLGAVGRTPPTPFTFTTQLAAEAPECLPTYARQFAHTDWIDGESRVQAGMTPEELGFNGRFHAIENELDRVAADLHTLGGCQATLRGLLSQILKQLESKITDLQNQIFALKQVPAPTVTAPLAAPPAIGFVGRTRVGTEDMLILKDGNDFRLVKLNEAVLPGGPGPQVAGQPAVIADVLGKFSTAVVANPEIAAQLAAGTTVSGLIQQFGDIAIDTGPQGDIKMKDVLQGLPQEATFADTGALINAVVEHGVSQLDAAKASLVRESLLTDEAKERSGAALLNSGLTVLRGIDTATASTLGNAGFNTVTKLASASVAEVTSALAQAGVTGVSEATVANAVAAAKLTRAVSVKTG